MHSRTGRRKFILQVAGRTLCTILTLLQKFILRFQGIEVWPVTVTKWLTPETVWSNLQIIQPKLVPVFLVINAFIPSTEIVQDHINWFFLRFVGRAERNIIDHSSLTHASCSSSPMNGSLQMARSAAEKGPACKMSDYSKTASRPAPNDDHDVPEQ